MYVQLHQITHTCIYNVHVHSLPLTVMYIYSLCMVILLRRSMAEDNKQHELVLTAAEERERELRMTLTEMEAEKQRMEEHILKEKAEVEESCQRQRKIVLDKQNLEEEVKRLKLTNSHLVEEVKLM